MKRRDFLKTVSVATATASRRLVYRGRCLSAVGRESGQALSLSSSRLLPVVAGVGTSPRTTEVMSCHG